MPITLRFERTFDYGLVRQIMTHPAIYSHMVSDGAPTAEEYQVAQVTSILYVLVFCEEMLSGLFILVPHTSVCFEVHTCFLPVLRGRLAIEAYKAGLQWLRSNTTCRKVLGFTPAYNRAALFVAFKAGLQKIGVNTKSIMHNGNLEDQVILGMEL